MAALEAGERRIAYAYDAAGQLALVDKGTLFLDEIGDMVASLQAKLTRALQQRAVRRVGESTERPVDVRLIAATHRNLEQMVANQAFREDLYYRLNVAAVHIPPLRERRDDVELLAISFLRDCIGSSGRSIRGLTPAALEALSEYEWPGNVRQLRGAIERACVVARGERVDVGDLPPEVLARVGGTEGQGILALTWSQALERCRADIAREYLKAVLKRYEGQVSDAAAHAGIERESFYRLMRRYGVDPDVSRRRK